MESQDLLVGTTTFESLDEAQRFARELVNQRLAACCQVVPGITSYYWWQGALEAAAECLVIFKTRRELLPDLEAFFSLNHSYDTPELILQRAEHVGARYLRWAEGELRR